MNYSITFFSILFILFIFPNFVFTSENNQDTIYLKDNTIITGKIVEFTDGREYEIHLDDGSRYIFTMEQIDKLNMVRDEEPPVIPIDWEFGFTFGTPALGNILVSKHFGVNAIKASGYHFRSGTYGLQLDYIYKFAEFTNTYHALNAGIGTYNWKTICKYPDGSEYSSNDYRTYAGIAYNFNFYGFYFQAGIDYSFDIYDKFQLMGQIGYAYQLRR